jgi:hypothetical protein
MVETKKICCYTNNMNEILKDLKKWNVYIRDHNSSCVIFELQSSNTLYEIVLYNYQVATLPFTYVDSFEDLQMKILGRVIWNWK